ncbi:paraquat-inducible protein A [Endozoicomonas sp. SM1973]|uniref:Paraquat-inducible protein A n=1 Tax=Spartinivicinus marinus TaxID=2994442 RepID=A0A853I1F2_9GAMM|nr:paraquat-inducible protein A [Spartinivicinus marinus]MCX4024906.1 paraquat-inducible protein A [Spartinivicinus marinus]NYZ66449.1 paraquat-inducible protein A [Spartinivicinus marinus]
MDTLTACHECDLLVPIKPLPKGCKARCPRCGYTLYENTPHTVEKTLALCLSAIILFIPAITLPLLSMRMLGQSQHDTVVAGIYVLFTHDLWWTALLISFCSIIAPFIKLLLLTYVLMGIIRKKTRFLHIQAFRGYQKLDTWSMLEVYMLGILVSMIKLLELAELHFGLGLACFIGLLLAVIFIRVILNKHQVWSLLEQYRVN